MSDTDHLWLAIDIGFRNTGLALFEDTPGGIRLIETHCITTDHIKKSKRASVALVDMEKTLYLAKQLGTYMSERHVPWVVVELPTGGAKNSRAVRCMGMASAIIGTLVATLGCGAEWTTPREGKLAATDKPDAEKDEMMEAVGKMFPAITSIPKCRREHIADACAAMLALKKRQGK